MTQKNPDMYYDLGEQFEPELFWQRHGRQILIGLAIVLAIGAAGYLWQRSVASRKEEAANRLAAARDVAALESILRDYPKTEVAAQAILKLADLNYQEGRLDAAGQLYERFLSEFPSHSLIPSARLGQAATMEAQGKLPEAKALYTQLATNQRDSYAVFAAKQGLARCAEALGQVAEARQIYEELMALAQGSPQQFAVYLRWTALSRDLPKESAPAATNAAVVIPGAAVPAAAVPAMAPTP